MGLDKIDINALLQLALPALIRIIIIVFGALGVVYMAGRLLFPSMKDRGKNVIAFFSILTISFITTLVYDYETLLIKELGHELWKYITDSMVYATIGSVFYVVIGWRFYSRMDSLLDRKVGKDNRGKK